MDWIRIAARWKGDDMSISAMEKHRKECKRSEMECRRKEKRVIAMDKSRASTKWKRADAMGYALEKPRSDSQRISMKRNGLDMSR